MNSLMVSASTSQLRNLSPLANPARTAEPSSTPSSDRFERIQPEQNPSASGISWGMVGLAGLGVLAAGTGVVQAQMQAPPPSVRADLVDGKVVIQTGEGPLVVAHRGDTENATENTLEAFKNAIAEGAGAVT